MISPVTLLVPLADTEREQLEVLARERQLPLAVLLFSCGLWLAINLGYGTPPVRTLPRLLWHKQPVRRGRAVAVPLEVSDYEALVHATSEVLVLERELVLRSVTVPELLVGAALRELAQVTRQARQG